MGIHAYFPFFKKYPLVDPKIEAAVVDLLVNLGLEKELTMGSTKVHFIPSFKIFS